MNVGHVPITDLFAILPLGSAHTEVTLDGSLGPAGALPGPHFAITADLGQQHGGNLFHSFGVFDIDTGQSATFSGPLSIQNILGRVTGGDPSDINGTLRSTIPEADLWLINPAGVVFGENAKLEVQGSFHASTADFVRLADGRRFDATQAQTHVLTSAPPAAFGFFGPNPASLSVNGSALDVPEGETLSLVGGDIDITGGAAISARLVGSIWPARIPRVKWS